MIGQIIKIIRRKLDALEINYEKSCLGHCGDNVLIEKNCIFKGPKNISIGDNVYINANCVFLTTDSKIEIGSHVMFGVGVCIITGDHRTDVVGKYMIDVHNKLPENDQPVKICDDVWIGSGVTILKGVTIGCGSIIGAGSVVTKSLPPYSVCVGNPAKVIKMRFDDKTIITHEKLLNNNILK